MAQCKHASNQGNEERADHRMAGKRYRLEIVFNKGNFILQFGNSFMIQNIYAKNYRAFPELNLDLSKINLIFGPNNSGKSSIISIFNLLSQTLISSDQNVSLLLTGSKEDLGTYRDIVHKHDVQNDITFRIKCKLSLDRLRIGARKRRFSLNDIEGSIELQYGFMPKRHEIILKKVSYLDEDSKFLVKFEKSKTSRIFYLTYLKTEDKEFKNIRKKIENVNHFIPHYFLHDYDVRNDSSRFFEYLFNAELKNIEFIGPFRLPPQRTYLFSGENPQSVGIHGEKAIDIITMDSLKQKGKGKKNLFGAISNWFKTCEITDEIKINKISDRHFEIVLSNKESTKGDNLADVGYGCSQILPILAGGYNLPDDGIFIVQEPEIHLHPKAQAELGTFFYDLSKRGVQSIIETHSEHLLLRLQAHVADKNSDLTPEDVRIYYINTDKNKREIKKMELGEDGFFKDDWPKGFFPERLIEAKKIAKRSLST